MVPAASLGTTIWPPNVASLCRRAAAAVVAAPHPPPPPPRRRGGEGAVPPPAWPLGGHTAAASPPPSPTAGVAAAAASPPPPPGPPPSGADGRMGSTVDAPHRPVPRISDIGGKQKIMWVAQAMHKEMGMLAKRGAQPKHIFEAFWRHCGQFEPDMNDLDSCLNALVKCKPGASGGTILDAGNMLRLLDWLEAHLRPDLGGSAFPDNRNLANIAWALARLSRVQPSLPAEVVARMPAIFALVEEHACPAMLRGGFPPRHICILAWGFARAGVGSPSFYATVGEAASKRLEQLSPRNLSNLVWAFATARATHEVVSEIPRLIVSRGRAASTDPAVALTSFTEQDISNLAWAYGSMHMAQPELFHCVSAALQSRTGEFSARGLVNCIWAFATLREDAPFTVKMADQFDRCGRWRDLDARGCATLLWALATLPYAPWLDTFFVSIAEKSLRPRVGQVHAQDVSNSLWAFAKVGVPDPELFDLLSARVIEIIGTFNPQALANVAWSFSKMKAGDPAVYEAITTEALRRSLRAWPPQAVATTAWALAEVGAPCCAKFATAAVGELQVRIEAFNDVDLATLTRLLHEELGGHWGPGGAELRRDALARVAAEANRRNLPRTRDALDERV